MPNEIYVSEKKSESINKTGFHIYQNRINLLEKKRLFPLSSVNLKIKFQHTRLIQFTDINSNFAYRIFHAMQWGKEFLQIVLSSHFIYCFCLGKNSYFVYSLKDSYITSLLQNARPRNYHNLLGFFFDELMIYFCSPHSKSCSIGMKKINNFCKGF